MTQTELEKQYTPEEKELFVTYRRRTANGDIVHNWGSYTSKANFKRDWKWLRNQIEMCDVLITATKQSWNWTPKTGWINY